MPSGRNKAAMYVAVVAGILLLVSGMSGAAAWADLGDFVKENVSDNEAVHYLFAILILIASMGGIAVIIGGLLIYRNATGTGKFLIGLGAGMGLLGFIISVAVAASQGTVSVWMFGGLGAFGVFLAVVAQMMAKKVDEPEEKKGKKNKSGGGKKGGKKKK